jgi:RHS repeat-associated protein
VFNESYVAVDGGAWRVPQTAGFNPGQEAQGYIDANNRVKFNDPITINQPGYIYVWVSNESEATKVWFDDLTVVHRKNIVSQATDYETWGGVLREEKYDPDDQYRYGYQGKYAERDDETGWSAFESRNFDPLIGRWATLDPAREFWSRYLGMGNNPILFSDPDGETIIINGYTYVPGQEYTGKNMFIAGTVKSLNRLYQAEQKLGKSIIGDLSKPGVELRILKSSESSMGYRGDGTLGFNLNSGLYIYDGDPRNKESKVTGTQSPEIGLIHELGHAHDDLINNTWWDHYNDKSTKPDFKDMAEKIAVGIENEYIKQMNMMFNLNNMLRFNDYGRPFTASSPDSNLPPAGREHKNNTRGF